MAGKITLVLGAGASVAMGYPVGAALRKEIIEKATGFTDIIFQNADEGDEKEIDDFVAAFEKSQMSSIDSFLARRLEYADLGKRIIAAILLGKEAKENLSKNNHPDNWYFYFYNMVVAPYSWDELSFEAISIITFNYDRSFEHYLHQALINSYGKSSFDAYEKIKEMTIVHIYGVLGTCDFFDKKYIPYGASVSAANVSFAASQIKVIPEGRNNDQSLQQARNILSSSDKIAFLGFGFDKTNLERLDSTNTCQNNLGDKNRKVVGTTYGMEVGEVALAVRSTADPLVSAYDVVIGNNNFLDTSCIQLLRKTLILN